MTLVGSYPSRAGSVSEPTRTIALVSQDAEVDRAYAALSRPFGVLFRRSSISVNTLIPVSRPAFALSRSGQLYMTSGEEYQILSLTLDGESLWALRLAWTRERVTDKRIEEALESVREDIPDAQSWEVNWPSHMPALSRRFPLRVDGHGHLYVYPFVSEDWQLGERPVDVYSPHGRLIFSGLISDSEWGRARGDFVYCIETDSETEEQRVVRYRLVEPF